MELYYDGELINFSQYDLDYMYLGEGTEGVVYRYKDSALKVYNEFSRKNRLDEETVKKLINIDTSRMLLPKKILHDTTYKFIGYSTILLDSFSLSHISKMKMSKLLEEITLLCNDADLLASNYVDIEDLNYDNIIYDGNIYMCDPGSYEIRYNDSISQIKVHNREVINEFLINCILKQSTKLTKKQKANLDMYFCMNDGYIEDMIYEGSLPDESVKDYVKRIVK